MDEAEKDIQCLRAFANQIREAGDFDTVQVFVTRHRDKVGTVYYQHGLGNFFARKGQVDSWLTRDDEEERVEVRVKNEDEG